MKPAKGAVTTPLTANRPPAAGSGAALAEPPTVATRPGSGSAPAGIPASLVVPGYEILEEIGRGGMGVVFKARQKALGRIVALKMIVSGGLASPEQLARFHAEAETEARLQHPGIVQVFEIGEHNGLPFFSLEFVDGGSLTAKMTGEPWPEREAAALMERLARAMHHAHQHGVITATSNPAMSC
jgi:serine/threonine-protein kinase